MLLNRRIVSGFLPLLLLAAAPLPSQTIRDFFDDQQLADMRVRLNPSDWQTLKDHYLEDTYYRCDVEWQGLTLTSAGIRSRGTGSRSPIKPALGIDFSKFNSTQRFLGLKSIVLRNFAQDPSVLHERLAQKVFQRMGLPFSRTVHVRLFINDEYAGLYLAVEPIDKRFLLTRFGEDSGDLFELSGAGFHFEYRGEDPSAYCPQIFEPKTHEDAPRTEALVEWIRNVNQSSDTEFSAAMARHLDVDALLAHIAVDQFLADWDGLLGRDGLTNAYVYRRSVDGRWVFVTWDKDMSFSTPDRSVWADIDQNRLVSRALTVPGFRRRYQEALWQVQELAGGAQGWLWQELERAEAQIREASLGEPVKICPLAGISRCSNEEFLAAVGFLRDTVSTRAERVRRELLEGGFTAPADTLWLHSGDARNPASGLPPLVPGSLAVLQVENLADGVVHAEGPPLPFDLEGNRVTVSGQPAPLALLTPDSVVFQVPFDVPCGPAPVVLNSAGRESNALYVEVRPSSPSVLIVTHQDGGAVDENAPASPGEPLVAWGNGFGPASEGATGEAAPLDRPIPLAGGVTALLDGQRVPVAWAGLAPGLVGVQKILIQLPLAMALGSLPLVFLMNGEPGEPYGVVVR